MNALYYAIDKKLQDQFPSMRMHDRQQCIKRIGNRRNHDIITDELVRNMVAAYVRHNKTLYDDLMDKGMDKEEARGKVSKIVNNHMDFYKRKKAPWLK